MCLAFGYLPSNHSQFKGSEVYDMYTGLHWAFQMYGAAKTNWAAEREIGLT